LLPPAIPCSQSIWGEAHNFLAAFLFGSWKTGLGSACQEKYLRELSVTPVEYFTGTKLLPWAWGDPQGLFYMAKMRYFRATGMIFPRLPLLYMEFEGIWGQYFAGNE
jgi:hypothetical protein